MTTSKFSDSDNFGQTPSDKPPEEVLLADSIGTEQADLFFESLSDRDPSIARTLNKFRKNMGPGADVTGGDVDDDWYQAEVVGEEAVGGQNPTPDQSVTEALLHSMGIDSTDGEPIETLDKLTERDLHRWELDPSSSEDYSEHEK
ncbi:MAG: hypothetical protein KME17_17695 [Cyanosarcina radialis HA8281-LM2]|nr:hypothetical protein [Cyanosarcina radialis HA8281-LM2]